VFRQVPSQTLRPDGVAAPAGRHLPYRPALDGIRALAVAAVLAYHGGLSHAVGGFLGVDAFFVLSGFLITSLLLSEWRSRGRIGLTAFWSRRARRLLPALFLMLLAVAFYAVRFAQPDELDRLRGDALATILYVANWRQVFGGQSYFDQFSVPSPLIHTWSLAIEEQYYLVWPLLVFSLLWLRRGSLKLLLPASVVMLAGSAILMAVLFQPGHDPSRVYYGTDTRAQSLLVGALLAMLLMQAGPVKGRWPRLALEVAAIGCAVGIGWTWTHATGGDTLLYRGGFLMLALGVAVVITAAVQPQAGVVGKVLSLPPLRGLGLISYGVYLWHWPIFMMLTPGRTGWSGYELFLVRVAVTLAVSIVSYNVVEMPVRRGAFRGWNFSWTLAPSAAACVAVALVVVTRGGMTPVTHALAPTEDMPTSQPAAQATGSQTGPVRVLVKGDSISLTLGGGIEQEGPSVGLLGWNRGIIGCGFFPVDEDLGDNGQWTLERAKLCKNWRANWSTDVQAFHPDIVLMLSGPWDAIDLNVGGHMIEVGTQEWHDYAMTSLENALSAFTFEGAKVALLTAPCFEPRQTELAQTIGGKHLLVWPVDDLNAVYREFAARHPDQVTLIDLYSYVCPNGVYEDLKVDDGQEMRGDGVHFTPDGAAAVTDWLAPQLIAMVRGQSSVDAGVVASKVQTPVATAMP
jgi:peptidoglycan/LPS O-acetylase OafA/YrhL